MTVLTTLACTVSATGLFRPSYSDIYETLQSRHQAIFGADSYIAPDSQDGQLLAVYAKAVDDSNAATQAAYNSFSPATGQSQALSNNVKINGIARSVPTNSSVTLRVSGTVGTVILNGVAADAQGALWNLPASVTIPSAGFIDVTATAAVQGAVAATANTITSIRTATLGWVSVNNPASATAGAAVESDAGLRRRQALSVALPSKTVLQAAVGAVAGLSGVTAVRGYENDTNATDSNGILAKTIAMVVQGGVNADIANAICKKKGPGCGTQGTTSLSVANPSGISTLIKWYAPTVKPVGIVITIKALPGYLSTIGEQLKASLVAYINGLGIGQTVYLGRLYLPAQLYGGPGSETFEAVSIGVGAAAGPWPVADYAIAFNEIANMSGTGAVALTVV